MAAGGNNYLAKGYGATTQWITPFQLLDNTGAVMFAVASDGTLTTTSNQIVANPGNFVATGTGEIDGNFSVGDAYGGSPKFKVAASSGNTVVSGTLASGALTVTGAASTSGALTAASLVVTAAKPIIGATASPTSSGTGTTGMLTWDGSYLYICTNTNTWSRVAVTGSY